MTDHRPAQNRRNFLGRSLVKRLLGLIAVYLVIAYLVVPLIWRHETKVHADLDGGPRVTHTASGIPGDPVNLALLGSEADIVGSMLAAKWNPADPITLRSCLRIAVDSVFRRPDNDAPVSNLILFGRKQDLAFEQPMGDSPRRRHHVRFWKWDQQGGGRDVWFGAATLDESVGLSHTTGQITHHIGPDIDAERERIMNDLKQAGRAEETFYKDGFNNELEGKNGGGDPWKTDGRLGIVVLKAGTAAGAPEVSAKP